jgi:sialate O-acetylesterase
MRKLLAAVIALLSFEATYANIRTPKIFGDNMVLQRDMPIPVYGWADAGEQITVEFMGKTYKTITREDGKWKLKLRSYKAGGPYQMQIGGKNNTLSYSNILIGDVWVASGQSNMEFGIQTDKNGKEAISGATDNLIHFFYVPMVVSLKPEYDTAPVGSDSPNARWIVCSPEALANPTWAWHGFSAVGYYFARQLRKSISVPIGMIASYKGGTPAQSWMSIEGLKESPDFNKYVDRHKWLTDHYDADKPTYPQRQARYRDSLTVWNTEVGNAYNEIIKKWNADVMTAKAAGQAPPPQPKPSRPAPVAPADPLGGWGAPTTCYNGLIVPILGYGIKGVIWYQGESNGDFFNDAVDYKNLFPRMISDWRKNWGQGNFLFLYVQLPNFRQPAVTPSSGNWPWVRESQEKTLALNKTGMAVITDAGDALDIHPYDKSAPGSRLALVALHNVYGKRIVASGPVYKSMKVEGNKIIISFNEIHNGLTVGRPDTDNTVSADGAELKGFGMAGANQKFVWAKAVINANKVIVSTDEIAKPEAVRYNWADNPPGNLYNKDGLPARPFRTDNWPPL